MDKPIEVFKSKQQLNECLKWWQEKLLMTDWLIKADLVTADQMDDSNDQGENYMIHPRKIAYIKILKKSEMPQDSIVTLFIRHCDEQILVHELLHCLYNWMVPADGKYESIYWDEIEHQRLDDMAKSLIMAKYDLPLSWFIKEDN